MTSYFRVREVMMTFDHAVEDPVRTSSSLQSLIEQQSAVSNKKPNQTRIEQLMSKYVDDDEPPQSTEKNRDQSSNIKASTATAIPCCDLDSIKSYCRPWNYEDYRRRLSSFSQPSYWFAKPVHLSPIAAAGHGWINTSRNTLHCYCCERDLIHSEDDDNNNADTKGILSVSHDDNCGWKAAVCPLSSFALPPPLHKIEGQALIEDIEEEAWIQLKDRIQSLYHHLFISMSMSSTPLLSLDLNNMKVAILKEADNDANDINDVRSLLSSVSAISALLSSLPCSADTATAAVGEIMQLLSIADTNIDNNNVVADAVDSSDLSSILTMMVAAAFSLAIAGWEAATTAARGGNENENSNSSNMIIHCSLCSRSVNLRQSFFAKDRAFDPLSQHRPHCPYIQTTTTTTSTAAAITAITATTGWIRLLSIALIFSHRSHSHSHSPKVSNSSGSNRKRKRLSLSGERSQQASAATITASGEEAEIMTIEPVGDEAVDANMAIDIEPAMAFKRVRGALSL